MVRLTSSLTLSVLGVLKTLVQVVTAIFLFGDDLGLLKAFGMILVLSGLLCYAGFKEWARKRKAAAGRSHQSQPNAHADAEADADADANAIAEADSPTDSGDPNT